MDLIHPFTTTEVVEAVRDANAVGRRLLVVGGRTHVDKGEPSQVDAELWVTQLDRLVAYEPAEMVAVVEAGMRVGELDRILAEHGQEWPSDASPNATVGGVIASGVSSPRRLAFGPLRDTVLETELVTGDGRSVRSGARTVKNVTGFDLHKLVAGSLGTLAVIVQVALKVRPRAKARRTLRFEVGGDRAASLATARELLREVAGATAVLATPGRVELRLEGWLGQIDEQTLWARRVAEPSEVLDDAPFPLERPWDDRPVVAEAAVPPSRLADVALGGAWGALAGVGLAWVGLDGADGELGRLRELAHGAGGIAPVVHGPGGLGPASLPAATVQRRLKEAFDPNGVLAPGRGWGEGSS